MQTDEHFTRLSFAALPSPAPASPLEEALTPNCARRRHRTGEHPQAACQVRVVRRSALSGGGGAPGTFSVVCWNLLSFQHHALRRRSRAPGSEPDSGPSDDAVRRHAILRDWLLGDLASVDVFLLQEMDLNVFPWFSERLSSAGYAGVLQGDDRPDRRDASRQPCYCATFWRRAVFGDSPDWQLHGSRALTVALRPPGGVAKYFANVHLYGGSSPDAAQIRAKQVDNVLRKVRARCRGGCGEPTLVLAGDFNTGTQSSLHATLRSRDWHGFALASVYGHPDAAVTTPASVGSFFAPGPRWALDHIFYSHATAELRCVMEPLTDCERVAMADQSAGIPECGLVPSDHVPLGAAFGPS